jgi:hypothetical protein
MVFPAAVRRPDHGERESSMRGATKCAAQLKKVFAELRDKHGQVSKPDTTDPITQLLLGVLSRDVPEHRAQAALDSLRSYVVDYNELRVIPPFELTEMFGDFREARPKAEDINRALNKIFYDEHDISLERIGQLPKKEMLAYVESIDGLEAYSRGRIRLLGFGKHAIPLDEAMWAYARQVEIIDDKCPLDEAQGFLERQIAENDALEFVALVHKEAWEQFDEAVAAGEVEKIRSVAVERKTSHMLADLAPKVETVSDELDEAEAFSDVDAASAKSSKKAAAKKAKAGQAKRPKKKTATKKSTTKTKTSAAKKSTKKKTAKAAKSASSKKGASKTKSKKAKSA